MNKLEKSNFEESKIEKNLLSSIKGGTSTTSFVYVGYSENEYEDCNGDGKLSKEEIDSQKPIIVNFPEDTGSGC